jgi:hypothetical protein
MKQFLWVVMAGSLVLGACAGADREQPEIPSAPVFAKPPQDACSFRDAKNFASDYFALRDDDRYAADELRSAEGLPKGDDRNTHFFNIFIRMSERRATGDVTAAAHGANFILEARDCGSFVISHDDPFIAAVLTEALTTGALAYRAGTEGYVATYDGGSALWTANWPFWIGGRALVFGAPWTQTFGNEARVGIAAYRWGVIYDQGKSGPTGVGKGPNGTNNDDIAVVELCEAGVQYEADPRNRIGRVKASEARTVLQIGDIAGFCTTNNPPEGGLVSRVLRGIHGFFAPTPLQARRRPPGLGGGLDELSDILSVNALAVNLTFTTQPVTGLATEPFLVVVRAATAGNNDFEDVPVALSVGNNQGTPAGAFLTPESGCPGFTGTSALTQRTNELGVATFCVKVNKPGGYIIEASHALGGFAASPTLSDHFNRTGG